jgi:hypothetical protein
LLKVSYIKGFLFGILMTISVIGLLLIKYSRSLRIILFYTQLEDNQVEATHIYVVSDEKNKEICGLGLAVFGDASIRTFEFKHLRYEMLNNQPVPLAHHYANHLDAYLDSKFLKSGISKEEAERR